MLKPDADIGEEAKAVINPKLKSLNLKFDSIICTAGGWAPGEVKDPKMFDSVK